MNSPLKPTYDFNDPILQQMPKYKRWAKEHLSLADLASPVIRWEVKETFSALKIPTKYHIHYRIKSIVGIDDHQEPIYGGYHVMELTLPPGYPLEPCKIYMLTPTWHPNIKSDGKHKGRICGNVKNFGRSYDLYQLVLRVGEILQYKNYHAVHSPPYPEDSQVAHWVTSFAEPNNVVNKGEGIAVDDTPLVNIEQEETAAPEVVSQAETPPSPVEKPPVVETPPPPPEPEPPATPKIKIGGLRKTKPAKLQLRIKKRDD